MLKTLSNKLYSGKKRILLGQRLTLLLGIIHWGIITPAYGMLGSLQIDEVNSIIYGEDNRWDTEDYEVPLFRDKALSVAGMVASRKLVPDSTDENYYKFFKKSASRQYKLCEDERFGEQTVLPVCTGFLVAPNIIMTAGHCVENQQVCENYSWVFEYTKGLEKIKKSNIYECDELLAHKEENNNTSFKDYSVIKLKRASDRPGLSLRTKGRPNWGEDLVVIGHPTGLPQKVADNAEVKFGHKIDLLLPLRQAIKKRDFFFANLDVFSGSSGSPVFNQKTGLVEGILSEGGTDFEDDEENHCKRSHVHTDSTFESEEMVFRINRIKELDTLIEKHSLPIQTY